MITVLTILSMALVGAIIGGMTNSLAIKMLFRPYEPTYIGKWRLPFTPGLIPKRRKELAKQLGYLVVNHLVTPETVQKKLTESNFMKEVQGFVQEKIGELWTSERTLNDWFERLRLDIDRRSFQQKIDGYIREQLENWLLKNRQNPLGEFVPEPIWRNLDKNIDRLSGILLEKLKAHMESEKGREMIHRAVVTFLEGKKFGSMFQFLFDNRQIIDWIQLELVNLLKSESNREMLADFIREEAERFKSWTLDELLERLDGEQLKDAFYKELDGLVSIDNLFHRPLSDFLDIGREGRMEERMAESLVRIGIEQLSNHVPLIMDKLQIVGMVENQVDSFSTRRLEELVLTISGRELKMITYLGAYLGAIIGFIQGLMILIVN